jgi:hypothetical protein
VSEHPNDDDEAAAEPGDAIEPTRSRRDDRKERVLHTRVPAVLEEELKRLANSWRVPVSNVVRAILQDAVNAVEEVGRIAEGELRTVAERLATERHRLRSVAKLPPEGLHLLEGALGFTPIVVANDTHCPITGASLHAGDQAFLALFSDPTKQIIVSRDAVPGRNKKESPP